ncbi:MAG: HTTM domain-containing protein [Bacteroidia bacterium]
MKKIYGLDVRSLIAFRVLLAIFIASEFAFYVLGNFAEIYSPETGILGNGYAKEYLQYYKVFKGIFLITSDFYMISFIVTIIVTMLLLAFGFYPRIMAFIGCVLLYLFFNRYSVLYFGWEMYASVLLFWLIFIPTNSITNINFQSNNNINVCEWRSPLAFVFLFQIGFIYFYNGISKNGDVWMSGKAVESFLSETDKLTTIGVWFNSHVSSILATFLSYWVLLVECVIIFLLFLPFSNSFLRYWVAILIFSLHWGIALLADVGHFKYVAIAVSVAILPSHFWNKIEPINPDFKLKNDVKPVKISFLDALFVRFNNFKTTMLTKVLAIALLVLILFSNLSQTAASGTTDRVKKMIQNVGIESFFTKINYRAFPQYSFFTQYWHLYSPNPPQEKGYMQLEAITVNNDSICVFNGNVVDNQVYVSNLHRYFFNMLQLRKGRNEKEKIAEKYLMLKEIRLWNKAPNRPKLKALQIVHYSRQFNQKMGLEPHFKRINYKTIDIKYK